MGIRKLVVSVAAAALLAGGIIAGAVTTANGAGCSTYAGNPVKSGHTAIGTSGRIGCSGSAVQIKTRLVHYQPFGPHDVRASGSMTAVNWLKTNTWARENSKEAVGWEWYTVGETNTGQKSSSSNIKLW